MKRYSMILILVLLLAGCASEQPVSKNGQPLPNKENWVSLFNGKNLYGWTVKCKPNDQKTTFWKVVDGAIEADSLKVKNHDYIWLVSNREYKDFVLVLKFQAFHSSPGNSGIQLRSRYDDKSSWMDGPQIDINPPEVWRTGMIWDETRDVARWIFPNVPRGKWVNAKMAPKSVIMYYAEDSQKWNDMEITVSGNRIQAVLNRVLITNFDGNGILNDATHKKYAVGESGNIALQIHTGDQLKIRFKDILIKELVR